MLFLFCLFLCCFITRLTCKYAAINLNLIFRQFLFANNLARSSSVFSLVVLWLGPTWKALAIACPHYLASQFVCKRSQSDEMEPVETKPIAVSSMAHAIEGMVCKGTCQKDCFCRVEVLSVWMCFACDPVQVNFSFCPAKAYNEICIWLDPLADCELVLRRNPCGQYTV